MYINDIIHLSVLSLKIHVFIIQARDSSKRNGTTMVKLVSVAWAVFGT